MAREHTVANTAHSEHHPVMTGLAREHAVANTAHSEHHPVMTGLERVQWIPQKISENYIFNSEVFSPFSTL